MNPVLVALDVASAAEAVALANALRGSVGGFKVGKQLFTAAGSEIVRFLADHGDRVFLDLKFHDIPNTVAGAVQSAVRTGAWMINVHASGGRAMMQAAAEAAAAAAAQMGREQPLVVAVTVLTSLDGPSLAEIGMPGSVRDQVVRLATLAKASGLDGVVASPLEIRDIRATCSDQFVIVTPGIRAGGQVAKDDQARTLSAGEALAAGANYLVIGRPIIAAPDPRAAAEKLMHDLAERAVAQ
jgi:orotidine-5'-phosphate decarboxylase